MTSILSKCSIPQTHAAVAILKLSELEYELQLESRQRLIIATLIAIDLLTSNVAGGIVDSEFLRWVADE